MSWQEIALIVLVVALLVASGFIKRLTTQLKELLDCFSEAIQDDRITKEEWDSILKEGKDVVGVIAEISKYLVLFRKR